MDDHADRFGTADGENRRTAAVGSRPLRVLWPWFMAGSCLTLALCVLAVEFLRFTDVVPAGGQTAGAWWHSPTVLAALMAGMILTATASVLAYQRQMVSQGRDEGRRQLHGIAQALVALDHDPHSAWRALREGNVIDGHALWDAEERLVDFSGFLGRYIPHLADWQQPSARQVTTALVDSGRMVLPPGLDRHQTIDVYCNLRRHVPGLRELRMTDGQTFLARTVDLGQGRLASVYTNVSELYRSRDGLVGTDAFRQVFEQSPVAKLMLDAHLRPVAVNNAFVALLGHGADAVARLGWNGLQPQEDADTSAPWSAGLRRLVSAGGDTVRVNLSVQNLVDQRLSIPSGTLVSLDNVGSRWESEERLRLQATILNGIELAVLAVDRDGRVAHGNRAACALFQWSETVLAGTPVDRLLGTSVRNALDGGDTELEAEGVTWGGTSFPAQVSVVRLADDSPLPGGAILAVTDLTPRRALDLQLMHSARLATLGEMAASIAHEFNQCLHVIRLASEAVKMDVADGHVELERLGKRTGNILDQVDRLTEMVTHMRAISRRESQEKKPFRPQAAVDSALRMVEPLLKVDGIRVERRGCLDSVLVLGHQVRLEQVLLNLLNNGRDAIRDRCRVHGNTGGTITIVCDTDPERKRLRIHVRDDGTGIAKTVGEHIFEPFVTTKDGGNGLGLGLSISRGICGEMGGSLSFGNVEGGAEFVAGPPGHTAAPVRAGAPLVPAAAHRGRARRRRRGRRPERRTPRTAGGRRGAVGADAGRVPQAQRLHRRHRL